MNAKPKVIGAPPINLPEYSEVLALRVLSETMTRMAVGTSLGQSFSGQRDLYSVLGYPKQIKFEQFLNRYKRQEVAKGIIQIPVRASWRFAPEITESEEKETPFEAAWKKLAEDKQIWHFLSRLDQLAGIGTFAVLLLGLDDGMDLEKAADRAKELVYMNPYGEGSAAITTWEEKPMDPRFGMPLTYTIKTKQGKKTQNLIVHWTRVLHVCEDPLESNIIGQSRLEAVYNRLQDIEMVAGGSSEMFWRSAWNGLAMIADKDVVPTPAETEEWQERVWAWVNGLERIIRLRGMTVESLSPSVSDPRGHVDVLLDLICAATRIPKRLLLGSERGELASTQDEENWAARIAERQHDHCEMMILRPFIATVQRLGLLPETKAGYNVRWPKVRTEGAKETADIGLVRAGALAAYVGAAGADSLVPPEIALKEFVGMDDPTIQKIEAILASIRPEPEPEPEEVPTEGGD